MFSRFWPILPRPGRQSNAPFFRSRFFWNWLWSASLEPLIDLLAYLEPNLWLKKQFLTKIKVSQKVTLAISGQTLASHNSAADRARELFKPSKDSWSLVVQIKIIFSFGFRVLGPWGHDWFMFCGYFDDVINQSNKPIMWLKFVFYYRLYYESSEPLI